MKLYLPSYYKDFRCIGSACTDNCCIGWEIDIDPETDLFYRQVGGDLGQRLQKDICRGKDGSFFRLKGQRCPFLNDKNLCDIYINLGEEHLCRICDQHPRFHEWFGGRKESGVGLCCEAAARLILTQTEFALVEQDMMEDPVDPVDEELLKQLLHARNTAFRLMTRREFSFEQRLALLVDFGTALQEEMDWEDWDALSIRSAEYDDPSFLQQRLTALPVAQRSEQARLLCQLLDFLAEMEPIDPQWPAHLRAMKSRLPQLLDSFDGLMNAYPAFLDQLEQLACYFLYRYFLKGVFDLDVRSKISLAAVSCQMILLLDCARCSETGSFSLDDQILCVKAYSKEVEYSTDNLDALADACWNEAFLSPEGLLTMVLSE